MSADVALPRGPGRWARVGRFAARAVRIELRMYGALARALARRPDVPRGATGFRYDAPVRLLLWVFAVLSAVEVVVIDVVVSRWPTVRVPLLVLGLWGVVWCIGLLCANAVRPHTVGPRGLRVRDGLDLELDLPWELVHSVSHRPRTHEPDTPKVADRDGLVTLALPVSHQTNVTVVLEGPAEVRLPGSAPRGGAQVLEAVRLWADDPRGVLDEVRRHL
ncbi:hypothetical protein [Nocardioides litoris]|uniref:hypothetical protein n=1 Tax=Nocardioides litoris TaxID=1926648 RepID=UPI0011237B9D|nr:hypothetical protein [Nocardioides litoris]